MAKKKLNSETISDIKQIPKVVAAKTRKPRKPKIKKKVAAGKRPAFKILLAKKIKSGSLPETTYEARSWFRDRASKMTSLRETSTERFKRLGRMARRMRTSIRGRKMLGKLFMFDYDPQNKDTLNYYDKFPCTFVIDLYADGFLGVNLHYLPYIWRAVLMDNFYDIMTNQNMDETTRLNIMSNGYNILKKSAKFRYFKPCVRHYLFDNVRSRFMEVPPDEWEIAVFLPLERFESKKPGARSTRREIWMDTKKKYYRSLGGGRA